MELDLGIPCPQPSWCGPQEEIPVHHRGCFDLNRKKPQRLDCLQKGFPPNFTCFLRIPRVTLEKALSVCVLWQGGGRVAVGRQVGEGGNCTGGRWGGTRSHARTGIRSYHHSLGCETGRGRDRTEARYPLF